MRIGYLTCVYPPYPGGIGVLAQGVGREMARRGHEVHIFTPQYSYSSAVQGEQSGMLVHYLKSRFQYGNAAFLPQITRLLKEVDIVHLFYPFFGAAELIPIVKKRSHAKIIVHHAMDAVAAGLLGVLFKLYNTTFMPNIFKQADYMITLSEDYFRECDITNVYTNFPDAPPIEFVPNGVDTDLFTPRGSANGSKADKSGSDQSVQHPFKIRSEVREKQPTIVFASGLDRAHYFKGVHVLIEAMRILKERGVKVRCQIIGDGNMRKEYEGHAKEAGVACQVSGVRCQVSEAHIEFVGLVAHEKIATYYQNAIAAVVPSTERVECFSIVAAEAQACGIPAIVSNFPGVRVTIEDGVTGYVVRPGDPEDLANRIQSLVQDSKSARTMGDAARKRVVELYGWEKIGEKLQKIYEGLHHT